MSPRIAGQDAHDTLRNTDGRLMITRAEEKGRRRMANSIDIETQGEHEYVVRLRDDDEMTESWFTITPSIVERLRTGDEDEEHFVRRTAEFLVQRQGVADFPDIVDLEDVLATYSDYVEYLNEPKE